MHRTLNAAAGAAVASVWLLAGCSSLKSTRIDTVPAPAGLVYHLPTQELQVTLTVAEPPKPVEQAAKGDSKKPETAGTAAQEGASTLVRVVTLEKTPPFADLDSRYLLQYQRNHIGKNLLSVGIDENGLLTGESSGKTTPQLPDLVKGIASVGITARSLGTDKCAGAGTYRWSFDPHDIQTDTKTSMASCDLVVHAAPLGKPGQPYGEAKTSGYYYRQSLPMKVEIKDTAANITSIHYRSVVSRHSPTYFLPIPKAVFAEVDWKVTFSQGMPTLYKVESGGDAIGLFQLPAEIVQAYADAVLGSFKREQSMDAGQAAYLSQLNALALAQARNEACKAAVATGEMEAIGKACQ